MTNIFSLTLDDLTKEMIDLSQTAYRSKQIFRWIYKNDVRDFDLMSDISKDFRVILKSNFNFYMPTVVSKQISSDGTIKCLFRLIDGEMVESVLMHYTYGYSVCVSSEVGCNMSCKFCASGLLKKKRPLEVNEMVSQVLFFNDLLKEKGERVSHVVVMGTGEPFDNYENVIKFIKICNCPYGLDIGARHITVSTCGIAPKIIDFAKEGMQVNLAISLHASNNTKRNEIMPINKAYPLEILIPSIIKYYKVSNGRRVTFEYIMIKNFNDSLDDAKELVKLIKPTFGFVNLIPYNPVVENGFERATRDSINTFHKYLLSKGIKSTIRKEFGSDIDAACGQLRAKYENN